LSSKLSLPASTVALRPRPTPKPPEHWSSTVEPYVFSIALTVIFLLLVALLVFLYLHLTRQNREVTAIALEMVKAQQTQQEKALKEISAALTDSVSEMLASTVEALKESTALSIRTVDLMQARSATGFQASMTSMQETIRSQSSLLATKDPIAYHHVQGAPPLADVSDEPYPAVDDFATAETKRAAIAELDAATALLGKLGVVTNVDGSPVFPSAVA